MARWSLQAGETVLLHDRAGRRYQVRLQAGASYSLHSGSLSHDDLIGRPEGTVVTTNHGGRLVAFRPTLAERVLERRRRAQPVYPKDLGAILVGADIYPGARVLEAGAGTGALSLALLRAVGSQGEVVSYEIRDDFEAAAREAVEETLGATPSNWRLEAGDIYGEISEAEPFDRVCLDLPEPWQAVPNVASALRAGGIVFALSPNLTQVQRFVEALRERTGFGLIETLEVLHRGWTVRGRSLRPNHRMVAHTAFLTFARRLAADTLFETEGEGF